MHVLNVKSTYARALNLRVASEILQGEKKEPWPAVQDVHIAMAIDAHRSVIDALNSKIKRIEKVVRCQLVENKLYALLQTVPGIGPILAWIIMLESGDMHRFAQVGNFTSYCRWNRLVLSSRVSGSGRSCHLCRENHEHRRECPDRFQKVAAYAYYVGG